MRNSKNGSVEVSVEPIQNQVLHPLSEKTAAFLVALLVIAAMAIFGGILSVFVWGWHESRSAAAGWAFLQGRSVLIEPNDHDLGEVATGQTKPCNVVVHNLSGSSVTVNGINSFCGLTGCVSCTDSLPIEIPAHASQMIHVHFKASHVAKGPFLIGTEVFTDSGNERLTIHGSVKSQE